MIIKLQADRVTIIVDQCCNVQYSWFCVEEATSSAQS